MLRLLIAWWFLFLLASGILAVWELAPHGSDDIEIYLLPASFLLLSVWAMVARHQDLAARLASLRFDIPHPTRTDLIDDSDTFKHLFDGY